MTKKRPPGIYNALKVALERECVSVSVEGQAATQCVITGTWKMPERGNSARAGTMRSTRGPKAVRPIAAYKAEHVRRRRSVPPSIWVE